MPSTDQFDGFYAIFYQGQSGPGLAQIQLVDGRIVGADTTGGLWDGEYAVNPAIGSIACKVTVRLPPGVPLATTGKPPERDEAVDMKFNLPLDFASRPFVSLNLPIGKVNVRFQKIR